MKRWRILRRLIRAIGIAAALMLAFLIVCPCPPWSLKTIIAERATCGSNLHNIYLEVRDRKIPFDREHLRDIEAVIRQLGLTCTEASRLKGRPARYHVEGGAQGIVIAEEAGNHARRKRFMAGEVPEERIEVDAGGQVRNYADQ